MTVVSVTPVVPTPVGASRAGAAGKGWHFGVGAPADAVGRVGEMYLDVDPEGIFNAYGPKLGATWSGAQVYSLAEKANEALDAAQEAAEATAADREAVANNLEEVLTARQDTIDARAQAVEAAQTAEDLVSGLDPRSAEDIVFDNASNGFAADDVQAAIEEVAGRTGSVGTVRYGAGGPHADEVRSNGAIYLQSARAALFAKLGKIGSYKNGIARGTGGFNGLAQGGGITVVVGNSTAISSTPDGATWTSRTAPASYAGNLNAITHNGTAFVAAGTVSDSVNIIRSVDGETWTKPTMPGGLSELTRIASSSSIIVAVGSTGGSFIKSEDDGATWDTTGVSGVGLMANTNALVHIAALGLFVAIGNTGGTIHTSPDGKVWTKRTPAASFSGGFNAVAYDPAFGIIIVGGSGEIQTSPDGATWTRRMSGLSGAFTSVVATAGRLVVTGAPGTFSTSDASTWTALASGTLVTNGRFIAVDGGLLYFSTAGNAVISHPPFIDWSPLTPASSYAGNFNLTAMIGNRVVAIGGSTNGIQTFDPVYDLATEFQVPNIPSPAPNVIPYMKAA